MPSACNIDTADAEIKTLPNLLFVCTHTAHDRMECNDAASMLFGESNFCLKLVRGAGQPACSLSVMLANSYIPYVHVCAHLQPFSYLPAHTHTHTHIASLILTSIHTHTYFVSSTYQQTHTHVLRVSYTRAHTYIVITLRVFALRVLYPRTHAIGLKSLCLVSMV